MRIAQLAPLYESVPPNRYGGTERVVDWLCRELTRRGHEVTLFASGDSRTSATVVPVVERALRLRDDELVDPIAWHLVAAALVLERLDEFDVIHSHLDYLPLPGLGKEKAPLVTTLHGRLDIDGLNALYRCYPDQFLVSISNAQRRPLPGANWIGTVYHGLPVELYEPGPGDGEYLVFLGRISPEKRPHVAIKAACEAGVKLVIAAKVDRVDERYFRETVEPLLGNPLVEFLGEVGEADKSDLLQHAKGLLFPILWPEPFGLAMIEAMAYGTPVITRRCGSTPEIVVDGEVGYLCEDDDAIVSAIKNIDRIDRSACRRLVENRFSAERMAADYEAIYGRLTGVHRVAA